MKTIVENINKVIKNKKYEDDFKVGSFIFHKLKFNDGFEVFLNDVYDAKKEPELVQKLINVNKGSGVIYKERFYHFEELDGKGGNIIFILFNPSKACPVKRDGTIENCYNLVKDKYSTLEVLNIYSTRNPVVNKTVFKNFDNSNNINFIKTLLANRKGADVVVAWGYGKESNKVFSEAILDVQNIIKSKELKLNQKYIAIKKSSKKQLTKEKEELQNNHAANTFWGPFGGFKYFAELKDRKK